MQLKDSHDDIVEDGESEPGGSDSEGGCSWRRHRAGSLRGMAGDGTYSVH